MIIEDTYTSEIITGKRPFILGECPVCECRDVKVKESRSEELKNALGIVTEVVRVKRWSCPICSSSYRTIVKQTKLGVTENFSRMITVKEI